MIQSKTTDFDKLTEQIIGVAIGIHKQLGAGFAEKVYQRVLYLELKKTNLDIQREYKITIKWNKALIGYHIVDFMINDQVIVEIKATGET